MSAAFWITTIALVLVAVVLMMVILVQRPQGGGLAGAFGGAGGSGTETVFGGRVGDALTYATIAAAVIFLTLAVTLNLLDNSRPAAPLPQNAGAQPTSTDEPE